MHSFTVKSAQSAACESHNLNVGSSSLTGDTFFSTWLVLFVATLCYMSNYMGINGK